MSARELAAHGTAFNYSTRRTGFGLYTKVLYMHTLADRPQQVHTVPSLKARKVSDAAESGLVNKR